MLLCAVMGIVFISSIPLLFDYSCDVLFPVSEAQITGCLNASGNIFGVVMVLFMVFLDMGLPVRARTGKGWQF